MPDNSDKPWPYGRKRDYEANLRSVATRWFAAHNFPVSRQMSYCLAEHEDWPNNIILPEVVQLVRDQIAKNREARTPFPLHRYVHHGLSSQAMLFNLIGPLIVSNDLTPLKNALKESGVQWPSGDSITKFEHEDRSVFNEQQGQPTSIDFVIGDPHKEGAIFIESKLVEKEFGGCSLFAQGDCNGENPASDFGRCYLHHIGRTYLEVLKKHQFFEGQLSRDTTCPLTNHYQFYRELLFALECKGTFVLVADDRSPVFRPSDSPERGLWPLLSRNVPGPAKKRMAYVSIQSIVRQIEASNRHGWISEFKLKYGLP